MKLEKKTFLITTALLVTTITIGEIIANTEIASLCRENIRRIDIIGRYGGDEFVLIMPATNQKSTLQVCSRLQSVLEIHPFQIQNDTFIARFSIGLTVHAHNPPPLDELLVQADRAMYAAKNHGKNCIFCMVKI